MTIYISYVSKEESEKNRNFYTRAASNAWLSLVEATKSLWTGDEDTKNYKRCNTEIIKKNSIHSVGNDQDIVTHFNRQIRKTRLDALVVVYDEEDGSYTLKNCVFIYGKRDGMIRNGSELAWEIAHELCHAYGAGHSYEGVMSRPYAVDEEFFLDTNAALALQLTAFYHPEESLELYSDYLTDVGMKWAENGSILKLKFNCPRSGPRLIFLLDPKDSYEDVFNYPENGIGSTWTLELRKEAVNRLVVIFHDRHRENISLSSFVHK